MQNATEMPSLSVWGLVLSIITKGGDLTAGVSLMEAVLSVVFGDHKHLWHIPSMYYKCLWLENLPYPFVLCMELYPRINGCQKSRNRRSDSI